MGLISPVGKRRVKTQKMCDDVVRRDSYSLQFVPNWSVTNEQINGWRDDDEYCDDDDDELIEWYNGYQRRKAQKASIKEELMLIAWHPNCVKDWCMSEDEKRLWPLISDNWVAVGIR